MKKVRIALIGCGRMGRNLVSNLTNIPEAELVAAVDANPEAAQATAQEYQCEASTELDQILARDDVDAVLIATPNSLHAPNAIAAAQAGKHVFTEKPMALSVSDARAMIQAAEQAGVKLMVGQVLRYLPPFVWIIDQIRAGRWGEPFAGQVTRVSTTWTGGSHDVPWRHTMAESGGALFEVHIHEIDFMCEIFGQPEAVWAVTGRFVLDDVDYYDTAAVLVRFAGGKPVQFLTGNSAISGRYDGKILCTDADIYYSGFGEVQIVQRGGETLTLTREDVASEYEPGLQRELREFVEAVAYDKPVTIPGEQGLRAVQIAEAAVISGQTGQVVELPLP